MKELLRIEHGAQNEEKSYRLQDYNLEVYAGEIIYIQGLASSGIKGLLELLQGERMLTGGKMYMDEHQVCDYRKSTKEQYHIYTITADQDLIADMTVAENLEIVRHNPFVLKLYRKRKTEQIVAEFLENEKIRIRPDMVLHEMDKGILPKLSMLKAKMHGARLIVLDIMAGTDEGKNADELCGMIQKLREEGVSFLILAEHYSVFAEVADRIQFMHQGRDLMEWHAVDEGVRNYLKNAGIQDSGHSDLHMPQITGFYDYEWKTGRTVWGYLSRLNKEKTSLYEAVFGTDLPAEGEGMRKKLAVIPRESSEQLIEALSIRDNIILTIPDRISRNRYGYIQKKMKKNITDCFYQKTGIPDHIEKIKQLSRVQRKILSVYRYEIARPEVMVFENPYWGMDMEEIIRFREYVCSLADKGIKIIFFSNSFGELEYDCSDIFISHNGENTEKMRKR